MKTIIRQKDACFSRFDLKHNKMGVTQTLLQRSVACHYVKLCWIFCFQKHRTLRNSAVLATMLSAVLKANNEVRLQRSYVRWFLISTVLNAGHGYCNVYKSGGTNVCGDIFSGFDPNSKLV